jgi:hypothetical protein
MSSLDNLRTTFSAQGVPNKSTHDKLTKRFKAALQQTPPTKEIVDDLAGKEATKASDETTKNQITFVTTSSLASFPVASCVITVIWKVLESVAPNASAMTLPVIPLILALLWGVFLVYLDLSDPKQTDQLKQPSTIIIKCVIGLINSFMLVGAVLGINQSMPH